MTRAMTPGATRFPRLIDLRMDFPKWMTEVFGPEAEVFGELKFIPEANLTETEKEMVVTVELPGMKPEDVKVELREGDLWITGTKHEEQEEVGKTFHRIERRAGAFRRVFGLPAEVRDGQVDARFAEGVLTITLPKTEKAVPKQIEVH
jgi:HSP20 family protein